MWIVVVELEDTEEALVCLLYPLNTRRYYSLNQSIDGSERGGSDQTQFRQVNLPHAASRFKMRFSNAEALLASHRVLYQV